MWQQFAVTGDELEAWVADNYAYLRKAARNASKNDPRAADLLHDFLNVLIEDPTRFESERPLDRPLAYFARAVQLRCLSAKRDQAVGTRLSAGYKAEVETLGPQEVGVDTQRAVQARADRKRADASKGRSTKIVEDQAAQDNTWGTLFYGQMGDTRWRYQTKRDAKLFDRMAALSLGEHIRGRSSRSRRGTGRSLVLHGLEVAMDPREMDAWRTEVKAYKEAESWTWVSCSTGYQFHGKKWIGQDSPGTFAQCGGCSEHAISGRHDRACALKKGAA